MNTESLRAKLREQVVEWRERSDILNSRAAECADDLPNNNWLAGHARAFSGAADDVDLILNAPTGAAE